MRPRFDLRLLRPLVWLALPLGFVALLLSLNTNIPRYAIENTIGKDKLGIFAALSYVMLAGNIVISALGQSASPRLAQLYAKNDTRAYRNLLLKLLGIGLLIGAAGVLISLIAGRELITLVYSTEYAAYINVFIVLMLAAGFNYCASFMGYGITAARYFRVQMPMFISIVGITALLSLALIPPMGLMGAAFAILITMLIQCVVSLAVLNHALRSSAQRNV